MEKEDTTFTRKLIASRFKKMRRFLKLTREDAAACLGITREQYKDIEMGKEELLDEHLDLLDDLRFDASYILTGIYSADHLVRKALEVMPEKEYIKNMERMTNIGSTSDDYWMTDMDVANEWKRISGFLSELFFANPFWKKGNSIMK